MSSGNFRSLTGKIATIKQLYCPQLTSIEERVQTLEDAPPPSTVLEDLTNVTLTMPGVGDILYYNGSIWVNNNTLSSLITRVAVLENISANVRTTSTTIAVPVSFANVEWSTLNTSTEVATVPYPETYAYVKVGNDVIKCLRTGINSISYAAMFASALNWALRFSLYNSSDELIHTQTATGVSVLCQDNILIRTSRDDYFIFELMHTPSDDGCVEKWYMDENSGDSITGSKTSAVITSNTTFSNVTWAAGRINYAPKDFQCGYGGLANLYTIPGFVGTTGGGVAGWFKFDTFLYIEDQVLFVFNDTTTFANCISISFYGLTGYHVGHSGVSGTWGETLQTDTWYHIGFSYILDGSDVKIYVYFNSVLRGTHTITAAGTHISGQLSGILSWQNYSLYINWWHPEVITLDILTIWDHKFTQPEIEANYNFGLGLQAAPASNISLGSLSATYINVE